MAKTCSGAGIGFVVGGGLGFLVATCAYASSDNVDVANYAPLYGLLLSLPSACGGAMIGLIAGPVEDIRSRYVDDWRYKKTKPSEYRVCLHCGLKTNPSWRERCQICGKPLERTDSDSPQSAHHPPR